MIAEREALRKGIEHLTVLFPTVVSSFDFQFENSGRTVQYKLNAQSLRLFGLHSDLNDAHRAGANRLQNKTTKLLTDVTRMASASPHWSFMNMQEAGEIATRNLVTCISHQLSSTSLRTPSDTHLELAPRLSSSLHRDSALAILRRVRRVSRSDAACGWAVLQLDDDKEEQLLYANFGRCREGTKEQSYGPSSWHLQA